MAAISGLVRPLIESYPANPRRYGLFDVATVTDVTDATEAARLWGAGFAYYADFCGTAVEYDDGCVAPDPPITPEKEFEEGANLREGDPFRILSTYQCGTVGRSAEDAANAARQKLLSGEQTAVERVLWNGGALAAHDPTLEGEGVAVVPLVAGAGAAISTLETTAYEAYGQTGIIHVDAIAHAALAYAQVIRWDGSVWRTPMGTAVSFGVGYEATGPAGIAAPAGFVWAFMTSQVRVRRSPVVVPDVRETLDRAANQWVVEAVRAYAFQWDCPEVFAIPVPVAAPATAADVGLPA